MPISIARLKSGKIGHNAINAVIAAIETALNGTFTGTLPIAQSDVTNLVTALAAKQPLTGNAFAVAGLPAAASNVGRVVYVSDGSAGSPCAAISDGTNWKVIALGATASAT